ncbi:hypothetical protein [Streptomyces sp. NBC_01429]|uniref:hypothetical protein n=1 Tax=Streptomyces sp. NBC_01429 TaxID=2903862 RepID=UPI002E2C4E0F|nr:hypothetical protein [Streptomyces sp. NBC_01429]
MEHRHTRRRRGAPPWGGGRARRFHRPYWARGGDPAPTGPAWRSSLFLALFVLVGTTFIARTQPDRMPLDLYARLLLLAGPALLLFRHRHPVVCVFAVQATVLAYFARGYPYGPVLLTAAVAVFHAIVAGHRRAARWAVGALWAGHLLISHWLFRWLPPPHDRAAPWGQELVGTAFVVALCAASELARVRREQWAREAAERAAARKRCAGCAN